MLRRFATLVALAVLLAGIAGAGYWAGVNAVLPPELPLDMHPVETYEVGIGTVGRSVSTSVSASWSTTRTLTAGLDGMVTSVSHEAGAIARSGDVIAAVDLEPVVIATGPVPMFRTLAKGVEGRDVAQFQRFLRAARFLAGPADGRFGKVTEAATKRWQRSIGARQDGIVDPGALLFVDSLPARLEVLVAVGQRLNVGSDLLRVIAERPTFVAIASASQRAELTTGMSISIAAPGGRVWPGTVGPFELLPDGRYSAILSGDLCGVDCETVPIAGETALSGTIELVRTTEGVLVPTSALLLQPSGDLAVTLSDGTTALVQIIAEADGFAIVDGLKAGTIINLPSALGG